MCLFFALVTLIGGLSAGYAIGCLHTEYHHQAMKEYDDER